MKTTIASDKTTEKVIRQQDRSPYNLKAYSTLIRAVRNIGTAKYASASSCGYEWYGRNAPTAQTNIPIPKRHFEHLDTFTPPNSVFHSEFFEVNFRNLSLLGHLHNLFIRILPNKQLCT